MFANTPLARASHVFTPGSVTKDYRRAWMQGSLISVISTEIVIHSCHVYQQWKGPLMFLQMVTNKL